MSLRNLLLLLGATVLSYACYVRAEQNPYARYVAAGYSAIDRQALYEVPDQALFEGAVQGMIEVLREHGDQHSIFVNQQQHNDFREELAQEFGGIGVRIRLLGEPSQPTVIAPPEPGTPAYLADIRSRDRIVAIDGQPTAEMTMRDVLHNMRGAVGEPILLSVLHTGEPQPVEIRVVRAVITDRSIYGDLRDEQGGWTFRLSNAPQIGYVRITTFGDKTVRELTKVLATLATEGIEALILDVRDNSGGALDAAVGVSDLFLRAGLPIVSTRGRDEQTRDRFVSTGRGGYTEMPIAVLINHHSASASEILAACLQDSGRAVVIGQRSYGKGTVQRLLRVESGRSLLKLTTATYWRPSERNIHRMDGDTDDQAWGVQPNRGMEVELDDEEYLHWRRYRRMRDVLGEKHEGPLADEFVKEDGQVPESFTDRALLRAVDHLQGKRKERRVP